MFLRKDFWIYSDNKKSPIILVIRIRPLIKNGISISNEEILKVLNNNSISISISGDNSKNKWKFYYKRKKMDKIIIYNNFWFGFKYNYTY